MKKEYSMKKEYKKPLAQIVEFTPDDDIMANNDVGVGDEPDTSFGYDEW